MKTTVVRSFVAFLAVCLAGTAFASEWPSWRGASQQGVSDEKGLVSSWSPEGENLVWHADFIGRSTPVVIDGRVCAIGRVGEGIDRQETVACWKAEDGTLLWERRHNVFNTTVPFNRVGWSALAADPSTGIVYANGVSGRIRAYAPDGDLLWEVNAVEAYGMFTGYGGRTQTPVIDGDQLLLTFVSISWGELAPLRPRYYSFDKRTGALNWISTPGNSPADDFNTQSVPVVAEIGGRRQLVAGGADGVVYGLDINTGAKIWDFELSRRGLNVSVLVDGDRVIAAHSEENIDAPTMGRIVCFDATGTGRLNDKEIWRNDHAVGFAAPSLQDGILYFVDNAANLHALDAATGAQLWQYGLGTVGKAPVVLADGKLYATEVNGLVHILKPTREGVTALDRDEITMPDGRYAEIYAAPAVGYGRVFIMSENGLYAIGDPDAPFKVTRGSKDAGGSQKGTGAAAALIVAPAEVIVEPGATVEFEARTFDASGRPLGTTKAAWTLDGLAGSVEKGRFTADADTTFATGHVTATSGELSGTARVRVIKPLPWSWDFDDMEVGSSPDHWINARGKFVVHDLSGEKVLRKGPSPRGIHRHHTFMGPQLSGYTIEADVMGTQTGRRRSDIGLINSGYTMDLMGAHQKIEVRSWAAELRMAESVPFEWEMGVWYHMKLRVDADGDTALVRGKVWKRGEAEPDAWTITVEDPHPIQAGTPGLVGFSPAELFYDNVKVTVNR